MSLDRNSLAKLQGVHPDLVRLVQLMATRMPLRVDKGLRTVAEQRKAVASGNSQTMNSRHLTGHAVDLYPLTDVDHDGKAWDWDEFYPMADLAYQCAKELGIKIRWGGAWDRNSTNWKGPARLENAAYVARRRAAGVKRILVDGPHIELPA